MVIRWSYRDWLKSNKYASACNLVSLKVFAAPINANDGCHVLPTFVFEI